MFLAVIVTCDACAALYDSHAKRAHACIGTAFQARKSRMAGVTLLQLLQSQMLAKASA